MEVSPSHGISKEVGGVEVPVNCEVVTTQSVMSHRWLSNSSSARDILLLQLTLIQQSTEHKEFSKHIDSLRAK